MPRNPYGDHWDGQTVTTSWDAAAKDTPASKFKRTYRNEGPKPERDTSGDVSGLFGDPSVRVTGTVGRGESNADKPGVKVMVRTKIPFPAAERAGASKSAAPSKAASAGGDDEPDDE